MRELVTPLCSATSGCSCVRSSMRFLNLSGCGSHCNGCMHVACHGVGFGEEAGARNLMFSREKWLQPAMKGTSCMRRLRLRSFHARIGSSSVF